MAKTNTTTSNARRQGRRPVKNEKGVVGKSVITLGELIAAAYDAVGTSAKDVAQVISSRPMTQKIGRRIVFV